MVDFDGSDLTRLAVDLDAAAGAVGGLAATVVRKVAADVQRDAQAFAPVDTGNLRGSISTDITGDGRNAHITAEIGPTAAYGAHVEFGTSRRGPAAFMGPALDRNTPQFVAAMEQVAARATKDLR